MNRTFLTSIVLLFVTMPWDCSGTKPATKDGIENSDDSRVASSDQPKRIDQEIKKPEGWAIENDLTVVEAAE